MRENLCGLTLCAILMANIPTFFGCDRQQPGYLETTINQKKRAEKMRLLLAAQQLIQFYKVEHDRFPESLDKLKELPPLPANWQWKYDNQTGAVEVVDK